MTTTTNSSSSSTTTANTSESIGIVVDVALVIIIIEIHTHTHTKRVHRRNNQKWKRNSYSQQSGEKKNRNTTEKEAVEIRTSNGNITEPSTDGTSAYPSSYARMPILSAKHMQLLFYAYSSFIHSLCRRVLFFLPSSLYSSALTIILCWFIFFLLSVFVSFSFYALDIFFIVVVVLPEMFIFFFCFFLWNGVHISFSLSFSTKISHFPNYSVLFRTCTSKPIILRTMENEDVQGRKKESFEKRHWLSECFIARHCKEWSAQNSKYNSKCIKGTYIHGHGLSQENGWEQAGESDIEFKKKKRNLPYYCW